MIGQTINHYKITAKLGAGGMGEVYLAGDTKLDRKVALKFLPSSLWNEAEAKERLIREAKSASKLDHPNVVTIYGIEEHEGRPFIIMAHVKGMPLNEYCNAKTRSIDELVDLALQMADGLQHAHENGVIHRDLKPSNVLVDERGRVRVLDFGIARLRGAVKLTQTGSTIGTLAYSPPELAQGQEAEPTSDVYSLGVVMYQMLSGRLPYDADHEAALLYAILNEAPLPLAGERNDIPVILKEIVSRCLEKVPMDRYQSCADMATRLKECRSQNASERTTSESEKPSLAVLPFANMSNDPDNEFFSDGLSEELMNVLAKNPGLKVTGRTSSFAFKGKNEDLRDIGQKLGVSTLLEGSVRKAGNRVRITTQLVKVTDGFHLWSETYDRILDDIFAVQDDIAQAVSKALHVTLLGRPASASKSPVSAESYAIVLRANQLLSRLTESDVAKSVELYQKAIGLNPDDARAWAGLALARGTQAGYGYVDTNVGYVDAKAAGERALALDDTIPEAHNTMGWIHYAYEYSWAKAGDAFRRARSLAPGDGRVLIGLATFEGSCGNLDEALRLSKQAVEVDPLNPSTHLYRGRIQFWARQFADFLESLDKAGELSPDITSLQAHRGIGLLMLGQLDKASEACELENSPGYRTYAQAIIYHAIGRAKESDEALAALVREGDQWGVQIAIAHAYRGELDSAFDWIDRSYQLRDSGIPVIKPHPLCENLHGDPRWNEFLNKTGLRD